MTSSELDLEIELRPMSGKKKTPFGEVDVPMRQVQIIVTNEHFRRLTGRPATLVGIASKRRPGMPINWLPAANEIPSQLRTVIAEKVQRELFPGVDPVVNENGPPGELPNQFTGGGLGEFEEGGEGSAEE